MTIDGLEAAALALPADELDELMDRLAVRRGMKPEVEQAWFEEARRRIAGFDAGTVAAIPADETLAKLRSMLR